MLRKIGADLVFWVLSLMADAEYLSRRRGRHQGLLDFCQTCAMHSTDTKIPAGKGITWGVLLAGAFSGKNSLYILLITAKSFPVTMKMVVFTTFDMSEPASSSIVFMLVKLWRTCCSKSVLIICPVAGSNPGVPDMNMRLSVIMQFFVCVLVLFQRSHLIVVS